MIMKNNFIKSIVYIMFSIIIAIFIYRVLFNKNEVPDNPIPSSTSVSIDSINLDRNNLIMASGASDKLTISIKPSNANYNEIVFFSSNPSVVTVSNNGNDIEIKAHSNGNAIIKVSSSNGIVETCEVKVVDNNLFDQRNIAIINYLNNSTADNLINTYNTYNCVNNSCITPQKYVSAISGLINVYKYNINDNTKELLTTTTNDEINYYLIPNNTYYLESIDNHDNVEVVTITGNLRIPDVPKLNNIRDLGGWSADGGTVKYGKLFRSERPDSSASVLINNLKINKVVDLREKDQVTNTSSSLDRIRKIISTLNYSTDKSGHSRDAVLEIMQSVVNNQNVLFHCQVGRDRTGTIAYLLEGILGIPLDERHIDYELSYFALGERTRTFGNYNNLINRINEYNMNNFEQERFINWFLSFSTNKEQDIELINEFRKTMIDGSPHIYKIEKDILVLKQ